MLDRHLFRLITEALGPECVRDYPKDKAVRIVVQKALYLLAYRRKNPASLKYPWRYDTR